jgi:hypothetical protein
MREVPIGRGERPADAWPRRLTLGVQTTPDQAPHPAPRPPGGPGGPHPRGTSRSHLSGWRCPVGIPRSRCTTSRWPRRWSGSLLRLSLPHPRLPVREPGCTTPPGLPPHGKTAEAPYSKFGSPRRGIGLSTCASKRRVARIVTSLARSVSPGHRGPDRLINLSHVGRGPAASANGPASAGWWKRPIPARLPPPRTTPIAHVPWRGT